MSNARNCLVEHYRVIRNAGTLRERTPRENEGAEAKRVRLDT